MAYNPFPANYQPYNPNAYNLYTANMGSGQPNQSTGLKWVQGEAAAKSYPIAPGNTVDLWDSEAQVIYLKSADASGMPSMKILDYTIRETNTGKVNTIQTADYATKEDVISIQKQIDDIRASLKKGGRHESTVSADE